MNGNGHDPAKMWAHSNHVKEVVAEVMMKKPYTVGDRRLLQLEVWKRYGVKCRYDSLSGQISFTFQDFEHQRRIPAPNTIVRRAQELLAWDRLRCEMGLPKLFSRTTRTEAKWGVLDDMYRGYYGHQSKLQGEM